MIERILAGTTTDADIASARESAFDERKKIIERLLGTLDAQFEEAVLLENALEDISTALKQARPVFAAGLSVDQALGFITKMISQSLDDLGEAGEADSLEYEKQELVLEKLNGFIGACNQAGKTQGEDAMETVRFEYRGEMGRLDALKNEAESGIGNSLAFLNAAYGDGPEIEAFLKGLDHRNAAMRFISKFGSPSFFAFKHVAAPGHVYGEASGDTEGD